MSENRNFFIRFWNNFSTSGAGSTLSTEQRRRVVFLNLILIAGMLILLYFGINRYLGDDIGTSVADLGAFFVLLFVFFYMRIRKRFLLGSYTICIAIFLLFGFLLYTGGEERESSFWIQTYPLVAIFILGLSPGLILSGLFFVLSCFIVFFPGLAPVVYGFNFGLRIIGSYILVFVFAMFYEYARKDTQGKLEKISSDLLAAKKQTDSIMENVKEGIFLLGDGFKLGSEYSKELETILGVSDLKNKSFIDMIENKLPVKAVNATKDYLAMFYKPDINRELLEEINPLEKVEMNFIKTDSGFTTKHLEFVFAPFAGEKASVNILGTVKDVTEEVILSDKLKAQESENKKRMETLFRIINIDPQMLNDFITDSEAEIENANTVLKSDDEDYLQAVNSIYQSVHAIKGNAILLGLSEFGGKLHRMEDEISILREQKCDWDQLLKLTFRLSEVQNEINEIKTLVAKVLSFQTSIKAKQVEKKDLLLNALQRTIDRMNQESGKEVVLDAENFDSHLISNKYRKIIKDILIQLTRNAVSHGIESPDQRISKNKERAGVIYLSLEKNDNKLNITFRDDGRGLDLEKIKLKAKTLDEFKSLNLNEMDSCKIVGLIFKPGFTTAQNTTLSSGRGIGMNVVKSVIDKSGGTLKVRSGKDKYCEFLITLPL